jgi:hypothetical protein
VAGVRLNELAGVGRRVVGDVHPDVLEARAVLPLEGIEGEPDATWPAVEVNDEPHGHHPAA